MLKVGLIGAGFMGRGHLDHYIRLESEGLPVKLTSICDIDGKKFLGVFVEGNLDSGKGKYDFSKYQLYTDIDEMLEKERFDYVDICLPTYLHSKVTIKALNKGLHVLCEKPMALNSKDCRGMIEAAKCNNKKLMIGQCLRFWPHYEYLKECVDSGRFGKVTSGTFFRGGHTPKWSYQDWMIKKELSGGAMIDLHIHDVDMINWLFGKPDSVSTLARIMVPGNGYDVISSHYFYPDGKVLNAQADGTLNGDFGFRMSYRVNFEKGNLVFENGILQVYPNDEATFVMELHEGSGHYHEIKYFANAVINDTSITTASPESSLETIRILEAEIASADRQSAITKVEL